MNDSKMPTTSSRSLGSSVMVQAVRTVAMGSPKRWLNRGREGPSAALPDLGPATAQARQIAIVGLRLGPQKLHDPLADLPARPGALQLVVVARHEDDRRLGVFLEDLVRRQVGERLCLIAVDRDVVDVEEVVLPDDKLAGWIAEATASPFPYWAQMSSARALRTPSVSNESTDDE